MNGVVITDKKKFRIRIYCVTMRSHEALFDAYAIANDAIQAGDMVDGHVKASIQAYRARAVKGEVAADGSPTKMCQELYPSVSKGFSDVVADQEDYIAPFFVGLFKEYTVFPDAMFDDGRCSSGSVFLSIFDVYSQLLKADGVFGMNHNHLTIGETPGEAIRAYFANMMGSTDGCFLTEDVLVYKCLPLFARRVICKT